MLLLSRQHRRARHRHWPGAVEELQHRRGAEADADQSPRSSTLRAIGRRDLVLSGRRMGWRHALATTGDSYSDPPAANSDAFVAFRLGNGKLAWSNQMKAGDAFNIACIRATPSVPSNCPDANGPDFDFGSSPILVQLADRKRALVAGQKSGVVYAVDPDRQGAIIWQRRLGEGGSRAGCSGAQPRATQCMSRCPMCGRGQFRTRRPARRNRPAGRSSC